MGDRPALAPRTWTPPDSIRAALQTGHIEAWIEAVLELAAVNRSELRTISGAVFQLLKTYQLLVVLVSISEREGTVSWRAS